MVTSTDEEPNALVAVSVAVEVPAAVGVPETVPVVAWIDTPAGSPVADQVGEPVAVTSNEYVEPVTPSPTDGGVITGAVP